MPDTGIIIIIFIVCTLVFTNIWNYKKRLEKTRNEIREKWGKKVQGKLKEEELESISSYFNNTKEESGFHIDDITWNDLNMNEVFSSINNTQSSMGEEVLYSILRKPLFVEKDLIKVDEMVNFFRTDEKNRMGVAYILGKLGKDRSACISNFFKDGWKPANKLLLFRVLSFIPALSIGLFFINQAAALLFLLSSAINLYIHFYQTRRNEYKMGRFNYIISMVQCADKIDKLAIKEIKGQFPHIEKSVHNLRSIKKMFFNLSQVVSEMDVFMDYIKMFFLTEVINLEKINKAIENNRDDLIAVYEFIGLLDSYIAIASYRESLNYFTKPKLINEGKVIDFKEIYHPLITNPVSNSCLVQKSMLITGSNASGKSTFLKTVAINSIMAQTIFTCLAKEYSSSFFKTYTSMALRDDLIGKESYYIVEIKSLKRIIDSVDHGFPSLCFIDEILRGTNTIERVSASSEVLNSLSSGNCLCISATHDVELTSILGNVFDNYHFQEQINEDEIIFDYKLYPGRTVTRNAIKLLAIMGYNEEIVSKAENRAQNFLNTGIWKEII